MTAELGSTVELRDVLLVSDNGNITVGSPLVADAVVLAEVLEHGKGKKVINFKYKAKVRYRRKRGHRQGFTLLKISEVRIGGVSSRAAAAVASTPVPVETPNAVTEQGEDAEIDASDIVNATSGEK